jgi:hypothetical protein
MVTAKPQTHRKLFCILQDMALLWILHSLFAPTVTQPLHMLISSCLLFTDITFPSSDHCSIITIYGHDAWVCSQLLSFYVFSWHYILALLSFMTLTYFMNSWLTTIFTIWQRFHKVWNHIYFHLSLCSSSQNTSWHTGGIQSPFVEWMNCLLTIMSSLGLMLLYNDLNNVKANILKQGKQNGQYRFGLTVCVPVNMACQPWLWFVLRKLMVNSIDSKPKW